MAEQLAEHLWRLEIPLVGNPMKRLNSYLITGEQMCIRDRCRTLRPIRKRFPLPAWRPCVCGTECWSITAWAL